MLEVAKYYYNVESERRMATKGGGMKRFTSRLDSDGSKRNSPRTLLSGVSLREQKMPIHDTGQKVSREEMRKNREVLCIEFMAFFVVVLTRGAHL